MTQPSRLRYQLRSVAEITAQEWQAWDDLLTQQTEAVWHSPYFQAEFIRQVARVRTDMELVLMYADQHLQGFFPFHRLNRHSLAPVAEYLSDYHGPLLAPAWRTQLELSGLLKCMRAQRFSYNHLPLAWQSQSQPGWQTSRSLVLDLEQGYSAYQQQVASQRDSGLFKKIATAKRKLVQKHGALRFEFASLNRADFAALLAGKSQQFCRTLGPAHDIFAQDWIRQLMDALFACQTPQFAGVFSSLYAGESLIAAHFGLRSAHTLHYWFPWYDTDFADYSPGLILLDLCAEQAAASGLARIDLGRGEQAYKQRFATSSLELAEGVWTQPAWLGQVEMHYKTAKSSFKHSALGQQLRRFKQALKSQK